MEEEVTAVPDFMNDLQKKRDHVMMIYVHGDRHPLRSAASVKR